MEKQFLKDEGMSVLMKMIIVLSLLGIFIGMGYLYQTMIPRDNSYPVRTPSNVGFNIEEIECNGDYYTINLPDGSEAIQDNFIRHFCEQVIDPLNAESEKRFEYEYDNQ